jgi:hypothetical protein
MFVSYYVRRNELEGVDVLGLFHVLKAIGYECLVGNGLTVRANVEKFESKEHVFKELVLDIESLLERFKIKK